MRLKPVAGNRQAGEPVIYPAEICGMYPLFPLAWGVAGGIKGGRPLQEPEDIDALTSILYRPARDGFERKRADLDLYGHWNAIDVGAHVGAVGAKRAFKHGISHVWLLQQGMVNLHLATAMLFAFVLGVLACQLIDMGEVVH